MQVAGFAHIPLDIGDLPTGKTMGHQRGEPEYRRKSAGVIGTPLLAGRELSAADQVSTVPLFLVNEALVREFLPKGNPVGHHLLLDGQAHEIVGVVADVRGVSGAIAAEPGPTVYGTVA